jgi:hypothetical protein
LRSREEFRGQHFVRRPTAPRGGADVDAEAEHGDGDHRQCQASACRTRDARADRAGTSGDEGERQTPE